MLSKQAWIVPIPGTRKVDRLPENAAALELSAQDVQRIDQTLDSLSTSAVFGGSRPQQWATGCRPWAPGGCSSTPPTAAVVVALLPLVATRRLGVGPGGYGLMLPHSGSEP